MSIEALTWAFRQPVKPSGTKFVLVALANMANEKGEAYPSIKYLSGVTCQDRKSVIASLDILEASGLIADSGDRKGTTKQVKVYVVKSTATGIAEEYRNRDCLLENGAESGTLQPESGAVIPGKSTVFPGKSPENGTRIPHEPKGNHHEGNSVGKKTKTKKEIYSDCMRLYGGQDERTIAAKEAMWRDGR